MTTWDYRVVAKTKDNPVVGPVEEYEILEVYYNDNDIIDGWAKVEPYGESEEGLRRDLELMIRAFDRPVLVMGEDLKESD